MKSHLNETNKRYYWLHGVVASLSVIFRFATRIRIPSTEIIDAVSVIEQWHGTRLSGCLEGIVLAAEASILLARHSI